MGLLITLHRHFFLAAFSVQIAQFYQGFGYRERVRIFAGFLVLKVDQQVFDLMKKSFRLWCGRKLFLSLIGEKVLNFQHMHVGGSNRQYVNTLPHTQVLLSFLLTQEGLCGK